jgi:hypothetical protein
MIEKLGLKNLKQNLIALLNWCNCNKLNINCSKIVFIIVAKKKKVSLVDQVSLGVKLSFTNYVSGKVNTSVEKLLRFIFNSKI